MAFIEFTSPTPTNIFTLDVELFDKWSKNNQDGFGLVYDGLIIRNRYVSHKIFLRARPNMYYHYMMLHLRSASMVKDGEHPFRAWHSLVMHNGFIHNYKQIAKKYNYQLKTGIDSEVLVPMLEYVNENIPRFFELVMKETNGESKINLIAINTITKQYGMLSSGDAYITILPQMKILSSEPINNTSKTIVPGQYVIRQLESHNVMQPSALPQKVDRKYINSSEGSPE
jgi:predicted glutamine amidotransferase